MKAIDRSHIRACVWGVAGTVIMLATLSLSSPVVAEEADALEEVVTSEKLIRIRHADDEGGADNSGRFQVDIRSERSSYRTGEAIRFKVRGNRQFYLYLINIEPRTGRAVTILPNRLQSEQRLKYPGDNKWYVVPNENLEFYGDTAGTERIIMVASERYLDVDRLLKSSRSKSVGDFYQMELPLDALDEAIGESYGDKSIRIRSSSDTGNVSGVSVRLPRGIMIKELNLRIR